MKNGFRGNTNLKPRGTPIAFTQEQIIEYIKCKNDPIYFIKKYIKIVHLDKGLVNLNLYPYQEKVVNFAHNKNRVICKIPRQAGKTTCISAFALYEVIFNKNHNILIAANKGKTAMEIMKKIQDAYQYLPNWLQQGVAEYNKSSLLLENGSRIIATSTSGDAARGFSFNTVILDEFAFLRKNVADEFFTSIYPTISSSKSSKLIIISTPNGMNHFYKMWIEATSDDPLQKSDFEPVEIKWNDVPGRDESFKQQQLKSGFTIEKWNQEFECEFIGSSNTLLSSSAVKNLVFKRPIEEMENVRFYKPPVPGNKYFISVDTSEGKGLDYHAMSVIDITQRPFEVVATYRDNMLAPMLLPDIIFRLGKIYNDAFVLIETKSTGLQVADILFYDRGYENMLGAQSSGRSGQKLTLFSKKAKGLSTSPLTKSIGCNNLKMIIENDQMFLNDSTIVEELSNFVMMGTSYGASEGYNDDMVMTLISFAWATSQEFFKNLSTVNVQEIVSSQRKEIESNLTFGFILDGREDEYGYGSYLDIEEAWF